MVVVWLVNPWFDWKSPSWPWATEPEVTRRQSFEPSLQHETVWAYLHWSNAHYAFGYWDGGLGFQMELWLGAQPLGLQVGFYGYSWLPFLLELLMELLSSHFDGQNNSDGVVNLQLLIQFSGRDPTWGWLQFVHGSGAEWAPTRLLMAIRLGLYNLQCVFSLLFGPKMSGWRR